MQISHVGLVEIESSEGFSSKPYLDTVASPHVWTQGFGETKNIGPHSPAISRAEGERRLAQRFEADYAPALAPFTHLFGFNQNIYDALASFIWNCGPGAVGPSTGVGRALRAAKWHAAGAAMMAWCKNGAGQTIPGLLTRREREVALMSKPVNAGHSNAFYLTSWEKKTVAALEDERKIAKRHGGWTKVDPAHLAAASRYKHDLVTRVSVLRQQNLHKLHRDERITALKAAIG